MIGLTLNPVALITGAASGAGAACARDLARKATGGLILVDKDADALAATADALAHAPERVSTLPFDVTDETWWKRASDFIVAQYGRLDWAVVNAGANLTGSRLALNTLMPLMRRNTDGGSIVVLSTTASAKPEFAIDAEGNSNAGLLALMRAAADEGAAATIRVNAVTPGGEETPNWREAPVFQDLVRENGSERAALDALARTASPLARFTGAQDSVRMALMLLTEASPITGATLVVDAGYTL